MRFLKMSGLALLLLALLAPAVVGCGLFRGRHADACGPQSQSPEMVVTPEPQACASCQASGPCHACGNKCICWPYCRCEELAEPKTVCCQAGPAVDPVLHPGIPLEQFERIGQEERYEINGKPVSKRAVIQALSTVPDDRKELSLSFMGGTEAERDAGVAKAKEIGLDRVALIQSYPADNPIVTERGFVATGHPTVYLQTPSGKDLARRQDASTASLAFVAQKAAAYDPAKDPQGDGLTLADLEKKVAEVPWFVWFAIGLAVIYLVNKKEQSK